MASEPARARSLCHRMLFSPARSILHVDIIVLLYKYKYLDYDIEPREVKKKKHNHHPSCNIIIRFLGRFLWEQNLVLDLTQDFPNKISFHFLWVKMLPKNLPKIFRWPEMCPLDKILAQDFQMAAFTKILGRRDTSVVPLLSTENVKHSSNTHTACMAVTAMQR